MQDQQQQPQLDSPWAAEFKAQLADSNIPLATVVARWQEKWRADTITASTLDPLDLGDAEFAAYGVGYYDRGINDPTTEAYEVAAYEASKQCCWAELEKARSEALRRNN